LRERVESLGGTFTLEPASPRGVRLRAQVNAQAAASGNEASADIGARATT